MSPRPYNLENRRAAVEQTRAKVLNAARELIMAAATPPSIEAVAAKAGVARMTVYYQFGSRVGLLEALFDGLGGRHFQAELPRVMSQADPLQALDDLIDIFFNFWSAERVVIRRVRGMAALDPAFEESIRGRDERRRQLLGLVLRRTTERYGRPTQDSFDETVDVFYALTSFATFDSLAGDSGRAEDVVQVVQRLAHRILGIDVAASA
jgi:AcrR family transcriptional regulator